MIDQTFPASELTGKNATPKQLALLTRLIHQHGKTAYQAAKRQAGIDSDVTVMKLSRAEAARLIKTLLESTTNDH